MISPQRTLLTITRPQAILFDWDDTLIETWPLLYNMYTRVFEAYDTPIPDSQTMHESAVRHGRDNFITLIGKEKGEQALKDFLNIYDEEFHTSLTPLPGAEDSLKFLQSHGIPMGIVSNKAHDVMIREVSLLGWDHYFHTLTGRCIAGPKPSPEPIWHTLKAMHLSPSQDIWFMGDSIVDHEAAVASHCFSISINALHDKAQVGVTNWNQFGEFLSKVFS